MDHADTWFCRAGDVPPDNSHASSSCGWRSPVRAHSSGGWQATTPVATGGWAGEPVAKSRTWTRLHEAAIHARGIGEPIDEDHPALRGKIRWVCLSRHGTAYHGSATAHGRVSATAVSKRADEPRGMQGHVDTFRQSKQFGRKVIPPNRGTRGS